MKNKCILFYLLVFPVFVFSQKNSLNLGDPYADDQIYLSVSYSQFINQPPSIAKSNFSFSLSGGFIKDIILNKAGTISIAAGVGYGYDFFNHKLKLVESNEINIFSSDNSIKENIFSAHNLEFPLEFRWRTSTAKKFKFWRIYGGVKFLYNLHNKFQYIDTNDIQFKYSNITSYNKTQYGLTLSAGYAKFTMNVFYGLSPIFKNATINEGSVDTKILKYGLIYYFL